MGACQSIEGPAVQSLLQMIKDDSPVATSAASSSTSPLSAARSSFARRNSAFARSFSAAADPPKHNTRS